MGIIQENRLDIQQPTVSKTDYGVTYVTAATESPVFNEEAVTTTEETPAFEDPVFSEPVAEETPAPAPVEDVAAEEAPAVEKKKTVRTRKTTKKK